MGGEEAGREVRRIKNKKMVRQVRSEAFGRSGVEGGGGDERAAGDGVVKEGSVEAISGR